jgi:hypothetical protein
VWGKSEWRRSFRQYSAESFATCTALQMRVGMGEGRNESVQYRHVSGVGSLSEDEKGFA